MHFDNLLTLERWNINIGSLFCINQICWRHYIRLLSDFGLENLYFSFQLSPKWWGSTLQLLGCRLCLKSWWVCMIVCEIFSLQKCKAKHEVCTISFLKGLILYICTPLAWQSVQWSMALGGDCNFEHSQYTKLWCQRWGDLVEVISQ